MNGYQKDGSGYRLYVNGNYLATYQKVAILYDAELHTLLKHGHPEDVGKYMRRLNEAYANFNPPIHLAMIESDTWDTEELNRIINNTGYIRLFLKNNL
jgi:hypothetical protein